MKALPVLPALLLATLLTTACSTPTGDAPQDDETAPRDESVQQVSSALRNLGPEDLDPPMGDTPEPPSAPPVQGTLVRISSEELDQTLVDALQGTRLVVDTTGTSTTIPGDPVYNCVYPNQQARADAKAECLAGPSSDRARCLRQINVDWPNVKNCSSFRPNVHSYVDFAAPAESVGAVDVPFDSMAPIQRDVFGPGEITVDINYVNTRISFGTMLSAFTSTGVGDQATARVRLSLDSNHPTLPCHHSSAVLGCPDVELTNMMIAVNLTSLRPVAGDATQLGFDQVIAQFSYDRNLNNIPDALLTTFVDVDQIIKGNVQRNVEKALGRSGRPALQKALTGLVNRKVNPSNDPAKGVELFYRAWYERGGTLVVDYKPKPRVYTVMPGFFVAPIATGYTILPNP